MSKEAITIDTYSSRYRKFGLNLTALKMLSFYCKDHPNKRGVVLYDNAQKIPYDPTLSRWREKERIKACFSKYSLFGIVLVNTSKEKYFYMGSYVNGTKLSIEIDKEKNGKHVPFLVSIVEMLEKVEEDYNKTYYKDLIKKTGLTIKEMDDPVKLDDAKAFSKPILEIPPIDTIRSPETIEAETVESLKEIDFGRKFKNMTFSDLPAELQKVIRETIPSSNA